jgi:phosphoesterase RecJ-like protein
MIPIYQPKTKVDFPVQRVNALLMEESEILIFTHRNPDGDAIGSSTAVQQYLRNMGLRASIIVPNKVPENLLWLDKNEAIIISEDNQELVSSLVSKSKLVIALDFNDWKRIEPMHEVMANYPGYVVMLDHHPMPTIQGEACYSDVSASSTCEMVYRFFYMLDQGKHLTASVGESIYTGMITDTGSFRYSSTSPETHKIAACLMEIGIIPHQLQERIFSNNRFDKLKLWGYAFSEKLEFVENAQVAFISLTEDELTRFSYEDGDLEGLVNYALSVDGAEIGALFSERQGKIRISFRSKGKRSVNEFSRKYFEGGGHEAAAGGVSYQTMEETLKRFKEIILKEWD